MAMASSVAPVASRRWLWFVIAAVALLAAVAVARLSRPPPAARAAALVATAIAPHPSGEFVGARACAGCHAGEFAAWQQSQHAKAMQHATATTVLGDFDRARFRYGDVVSTFFRRDEKFFVNTDGADGKLRDFEISYTLGVYPLQQYLVVFPDGRLQALSIAWDARPKSQGGERWYHLYPDEHIAHGDPLHWTRLNQNWNWMCADCHTTKLDRKYDAVRNTYATTWSEMNVACEACHGPGSNHVAWAKHSPGSQGTPDHGLAVALDERRGVTWLPIPATGNASRSTVLATHRELDVCAQCHSRRAPFAAGMNHDGRLLETHDIALLTDGLYFPDGQQRAEVYSIGSFLQSKMHARGVTCSDCHNPHSGQLRLPGNALCSQCHSPAKYDAPSHTQHALGSSGAQCTACHMPTRAYMGIDMRHDHSFRIPRPDLSEKLGTPNACTGCHKDRDSTWAAAAIERSFGPTRKGFQTFGAALHDARTGAGGATSELMALVRDMQSPAIARATALAEMRPGLNAALMPSIEAGLADRDPMVRGAALDALLTASPADRVRLAAALIDDPSRIVRIKAARALAIVPDSGMGAAMRSRVDRVFAEYVDSQRANADRPEAHINLGLFYTERRDPVRAEAEYRAALVLAPDFVPGYVNLADLYRAYDRENDAQSMLDAGLRQAPGNADLSHALGLLRVRQGRIDSALPLLAQATRANPGNVRYAYVYGVALHDNGQVKPAIIALEQASRRFPNDPDLLSALVDYAHEAGDERRAQAYARRLSELAPATNAQ